MRVEKHEVRGGLVDRIASTAKRLHTWLEAHHVHGGEDEDGEPVMNHASDEEDHR